MNRNQLTEKAARLLGAHPYLITALVCLAVHPLTFGAIGNIPGNALLIETLVMIVGLSMAGWLLILRRTQNKLLFAAYEAGIFVMCICGAKLYRLSEHKGLWFFFGGCAIAVLLWLLSDRKAYKEKANAFLIIALGFCLKLYYVLGTGCYNRQHDIGGFDKDRGHAGYIEYLFVNHHLSDFDVRSKSQFYHPPLHHAISAAWLWFNETLLGIERDPARESIQILTLFYSMCILITAYKILRHFKLSGKALYIPLLLISLHPAFTLLSGSINNDVLSVALMMAALLFTLRWYDKPTMANIACIALFVGLGMMTKLSVGLVAPPIAVVFIYAFIRNIRTDAVKYLKQFGVFCIICFPLALWFGIRNYIRWGVPITYIMKLSESANQYIGDQSFLSRITDFSPQQLSSVYEQWVYVDDDGVRQNYNEYNPLITLLKNSLFTENINESCFPEDSFINTLNVGFFWLNVVIAAAALIAMIVMCIRKCSAPKVSRLFLAFFYAVMMVSYYVTAAKYPFTCTMDFRYITPTVITGGLFLGLLIRQFGEKESKAGKIATDLTGIATLAFGLCSCTVYLALCY